MSRNLQGDTALHMAVRPMEGHVDAIRVLLEHRADVMSRSLQSETALDFVAWGGHKDVSRVLLEDGADVMSRTLESETALQKAVRSSHQCAC